MNQKGLTYTELLISLFVASVGTIGVVPLLLIGFQPYVFMGGVDLDRVNQIAVNKLKNLSYSTPYEIENITNRIKREEYNGFQVETTARESKIYPNLVKIIVKITWEYWGQEKRSTATYAVYYNKFQTRF